MEIIDVVLWVAVMALIFYLIYRSLTKNYDYWAKQNIPFVKPRFLLGSFELSQKPLHELEKERYEKYGRIYGRFDGTAPVISVAEPELLKRILVKDFHVFQNHRDLKFNDPIMDNTLFILEGEAWKRVRSIVSPTFTSAKLRKMLPLLQECSDVLLQNISISVQRNERIDCQRFFGAFTMDAISRCAFGMNINSLLIEDDPFVAKTKALLQCFMSWRTLFTVLFPKLMKWFRISLLNPETTKFYHDIIIELVEKRKQDSKTRGDFFQLLLDAESDKKDDNNNHFESKMSGTSENRRDCTSIQSPVRGLSHNEFLAQCITFFIAGYEATTSLLSYATYNLATNDLCQKRLLAEITEVLANNDNTLSYESLAEMKYMDAILSETLRLCPSIVRSERRAEEDYMLAGTGVIVKKGMLVSIPVYAIHRDPQWYPDPERFDPERFLSAETAPPTYAHLPFGAGPRLCLGMRFVQVQVKMCLVKLIQKFKIHPSSTTQVPLGYTEMRGVLKANNVEVTLVPRYKI